LWAAAGELEALYRRSKLDDEFIVVKNCNDCIFRESGRDRSGKGGVFFFAEDWCDVC